MRRLDRLFSAKYRLNLAVRGKPGIRGRCSGFPQCSKLAEWMIERRRTKHEKSRVSQDRQARQQRFETYCQLLTHCSISDQRIPPNKSSNMFAVLSDLLESRSETGIRCGIDRARRGPDRALCVRPRSVHFQSPARTRARLTLIAYCHLTEVDFFYELVANLLHLKCGEKFHYSPFHDLVRRKRNHARPVLRSKSLRASRQNKSYSRACGQSEPTGGSRGF